MALPHVAILLLAVSSASGLLSACAPNEDLVKTLEGIHHLQSYSHLSSDMKLMITELLSSTQSCQLTTYMNSLGIHKILALYSHLSADEAHVLNDYLLRHLNVEEIVYQKLKQTTPSRPHNRWAKQ